MSHGQICFEQQPQECLLRCQGFNSFAPCNSLHSTNSTYHKHERRKGKRMSREPSTSNMEPSPHWSYPQVVDGSLCHGCLKRLAGLIATKHSQSYSTALSFIRYKTAFSLFSQQSCACVDRDPLSCPTKSICPEDHPLDLIHQEVHLLNDLFQLEHFFLTVTKSSFS